MASQFLISVSALIIRYNNLNHNINMIILETNNMNATQMIGSIVKKVKDKMISANYSFITCLHFFINEKSDIFST